MIRDDPSLHLNLRRIRLARGLSQTALARAAALSRVAYRNLETGASVPRDATLARIASALRVTPELLMDDAWPVDRIRFRSPTKMASRADLIATATRWIANYNGLETLVAVRREFRLDPITWKLERIPAGPERLAEATRAARYAIHVHPFHPIPDLCASLENSGIKILPLSVASPAFSSFSISQAGGGPTIAVNVWPRIPVERRIFAAARELGHLLLHPSSYDVTRTRPDARETAEATLFADELLMATFDSEWRLASGLPLLDRVLKLKRLFKVPLAAVLRRAFPHDRAPHRRLRLPAKAEPARLSPHDFLPTRLSRLVRKALETTPLTPAAAAQLLSLPLPALHALMSSWTA